MPDKRELRQFGLTYDDVRSEYEIEVWPENESAVDVYMAMRTQWRVSQAGVIGLDYTPLPAVLKLVGIPKKERSEVFESIRLMEATELSEMRRKNG